MFMKRPPDVREVVKKKTILLSRETNGVVLRDK